jgi:hypothetical protein
LRKFAAYPEFLIAKPALLSFTPKILNGLKFKSMTTKDASDRQIIKGGVRYLIVRFESGLDSAGKIITRDLKKLQTAQLLISSLRTWRLLHRSMGSVEH